MKIIIIKLTYPHSCTVKLLVTRDDAVKENINVIYLDYQKSVELLTKWVIDVVGYQGKIIKYAKLLLLLVLFIIETN